MKLKPTFKICLSILIGLVFLELCIRLGTIFFPRIIPPLQFGGAHPRNLIIPDKKLGYLLNPNFQCKETNDYKEYRVGVKINSLGLRDYEHNLSKGKVRILALGDSYTFGEGVELKDTYLSVLENLLQSEFGQKIEIIKAGIPGYGTKQEIIFLKRYISVFKPKIVLLGLLPKETFRSESPYTYCHGYIVDGKKINNLYLVSGKLYSSHAKNKFLGRLDAIIKHYYLTPQFMQSRFKNLRRKFKKQEPKEENLLSTEDLKKKYTLTFSLLKEYKKICLAHDAKPVIILIEGNPREDNFIIRFSRNADIPTLSLYPVFKELADKNTSYHYKHDLHWNRTGHKTAAEAIFDFIISNNLLIKN